MAKSRRDFLVQSAQFALATQVPASLLTGCVSLNGIKLKQPSDLGVDSLPVLRGEPLKAKIPSSGEELLRVGIGTYKTFDVADDVERRRELGSVLRAFVACGGTLIDSSPMYQSSERVVGDLAFEAGLTEKLFIATKVWKNRGQFGPSQMNNSFKLFKKSKIDLMQIHNLLAWKEHLPNLRAMKAEGHIRYIGITHYEPSAYLEIEQILKAEPLDFLQIPFSLRETSAERSLLPLAREKGVAVIANEPFAQGALFGVTKDKVLPAWVSSELEIESWAQFFLKYILGTPGIQFVIPGTGKMTHFNDNIQAAYGALPNEAQLARMRQDFASL